MLQKYNFQKKWKRLSWRSSKITMYKILFLFISPSLRALWEEWDWNILLFSSFYNTNDTYTQNTLNSHDLWRALETIFIYLLYLYISHTVCWDMEQVNFHSAIQIYIRKSLISDETKKTTIKIKINISKNKTAMNVMGGRICFFAIYFSFSLWKFYFCY